MNDQITVTYSHRENVEEINKLVDFPIKIKDGKICYTSHLGETEEITIVSQTATSVTAVADITFVDMFYGDIESYIFTPKFERENPEAHIYVEAKYDAYKISCEYTDGRPRNYFACLAEPEVQRTAKEYIEIAPSPFMLKPFTGFISYPEKHQDDYETVWLTRDYLDKFGHECNYPLRQTAPYAYLALTSTAQEHLVIRFLEAGLRHFVANIVPVSEITIPEMPCFRAKLRLWLSKEEYESLNFDGKKFVYDGMNMSCHKVTINKRYADTHRQVYVVKAIIADEDITWADIHKLKKHTNSATSASPIRTFSVKIYSGDAKTSFMNYPKDYALDIKHHVVETSGVSRTNWWFNLGDSKINEPNNETHCVMVKREERDKLKFIIDQRYSYNNVKELPLHYSLSVPSEFSDFFYINFINMVSVLGFENIVFRKLTLEPN